MKVELYMLDSRQRSESRAIYMLIEPGWKKAGKIQGLPGNR